MINASAPLVIPLANFFGLSAGTKSSERMVGFLAAYGEGRFTSPAGFRQWG